METTTDDTSMFMDNQDSQYLDIPQLSESAIEAKLRHLIRHRLGKCVNIDPGGSMVFSGAQRESGNISPCELCLQDSLVDTLSQKRLAGGEMTLTDSRGDFESPVFPRETMSSLRGKGRRQSLQNSEMYTSMRSRVDKPLNKSFRFTKEELVAFLPRKSFFNCHDKALKEAVYEDTPIKRRNSRRQNKEEGKKRVSTEPAAVQEEKRKSVSEDTVEPQLPSIVVTAVEQKCDGSPPSSPVAAESGRGHSGKFSSKVRLARKKMEDEFQKNEHRAVTDYLKYVQDNPSEYIEHIRQLEAAETELKPVEKLIKMAMIYQRGHHGQARTSLVVRASHDLKQRYTDPGQWQQMNKEKNQVLSQVFNFSKKDKKDTGLTKSSQDADKDGKQEADEGKTELERSRYKAEKWLKTVPMSQQLKARQMALEEVGEEDSEVTQWWSALRGCHYIRNIGLANSGNQGPIS